MKVAIRVPDDVFAAADALAARLLKSRSQLCSEALSMYLVANRDERITAQLNAVYALHHSSIDPAFRHAQAKVLDDEAW
jgi:metal-responsive CopG/Arc/MetJ family transcriptional regulator